MATIIAPPQPDYIRRPNESMRLIPAFVISSSFITTPWLYCFGLFQPSAALKAIVIVQAVELLLQIVGFASLFIIPPRDEEQYLVERIKKTNLVSLMGWCFKWALYPSSFQVHLAEFIIGCMIPIVGCWVILGVPHLFVTKFPRGSEQEAKHFRKRQLANLTVHHPQHCYFSLPERLGWRVHVFLLQDSGLLRSRQHKDNGRAFRRTTALPISTTEEALSSSLGRPLCWSITIVANARQLSLLPTKSISSDPRSRCSSLTKLLDDFTVKVPQSSFSDPASIITFPDINTSTRIPDRRTLTNNLVDRSNVLSAQSKMFYKTAKKQNSCCVVM